MKLLIACILPLVMLLACTGKAQEPPAKPSLTPPYTWQEFSMGADLSYVNEIGDYGGQYSDSGVVKDPFRIFTSNGCNTIRVRLWHNPAWVGEITGGKLYSNRYDVEKTIRRAKEYGMAVSLDFHYSDTWADPDHQETPSAWKDLPVELLRDSVYQYTMYVLNYLNSKGLTPEMVQVGNETNPGMLFPAGKVDNGNWTNFGLLLNSGISAVRDFSKQSVIKPLIILHVAQFQNAEWWVDGVINKGKVTNFDILGISHYPKWSTINRMDIIFDKISGLKTKYRKKVMVVETAYPWTEADADSYVNIIAGKDTVAGYPATPQGQLKYLQDLTQTIISAGGSGLHYWEPAWITSEMKDKWGTGSAWDNCTLFDFQGNALPGIRFMTKTYKFPQ
jgi:arabinogalactan endo-1,4-beta-galactosidase